MLNLCLFAKEKTTRGVLFPPSKTLIGEKTDNYGAGNSGQGERIELGKLEPSPTPNGKGKRRPPTTVLPLAITLSSSYRERKKGMCR